jgi:hypothetical protein
MAFPSEHLFLHDHRPLKNTGPLGQSNYPDDGMTTERSSLMAIRVRARVGPPPPRDPVDRLRSVWMAPPKRRTPIARSPQPTFTIGQRGLPAPVPLESLIPRFARPQPAPIPARARAPAVTPTSPVVNAPPATRPRVATLLGG